MAGKYDLIIFGASGHVGKHVVEEIAKLHQSPSLPFNWAVAGRSKEKLKEMLKEVSRNIDSDITKTDIVIAELNNLTAMFQLAAQTCVLINCIGPYTMNGERVVQSCLLEGTDYIDVSMEIQSFERMFLQFHQEAQNKQMYVISSCGLFSIIADCGVTHLQRSSKGDLNSVEMFMEIKNTDKSVRLNQTSWQSLIITLANPLVHISQQSKVYLQGFPQYAYSLPSRWLLHNSEAVGGWCVPIPLSPDISNVKRSQYHFFHEENKHPVQFNAYWKASFLSLVYLIYSFLLYFVFAQLRFTRSFLAKMPEFFTNGFVNDKIPTKEENQDVDFQVTFVTEGWTTKSADHSEPPNQKQKFIVRVKDPAYGATAICAAQAALSILLEKHKMPPGGGVFSPGVAFANTTIIDRLSSRGIAFKAA